MTVRGIDVSSHNPKNFSTEGLGFVIVKATEGRTFTNPSQREQAARGRRAGLVVGFYHFLWPGNIDQQARHFVDRCLSEPGDLLAVDWEFTLEGTAATGAEKDAFIREVKRLRPKHKVLLYCNVDFWLHRDTTGSAGDGLWIAHFGVRPGRPGIKAPFVIHQFTSTPLDTNVALFEDRAAMRAWATSRTEHPSKPGGPKVDLSRLVEAARTDPKQPGRSVSYPPVKTVQAALVREQRLEKPFADGHFGAETIKAYAGWQRRCGFAGAGADGIPGRVSLERLGREHGFRVTA